MGHTAIPKRACKRPSGLTSQMLKGMFGGSQELEAFRSRKIEVSCECFRHGFCLKLGSLWDFLTNGNHNDNDSSSNNNENSNALGRGAAESMPEAVPFAPASA